MACIFSNRREILLALRGKILKYSLRIRKRELVVRGLIRQRRILFQIPAGRHQIRSHPSMDGLL